MIFLSHYLAIVTTSYRSAFLGNRFRLYCGWCSSHESILRLESESPKFWGLEVFSQLVLLVLAFLSDSQLESWRDLFSQRRVELIEIFMVNSRRFTRARYDIFSLIVFNCRSFYAPWEKLFSTAFFFWLVHFRLKRRKSLELNCWIRQTPNFTMIQRKINAWRVIINIKTPSIIWSIPMYNENQVCSIQNLVDLYQSSPASESEKLGIKSSSCVPCSSS